MIKAKKTPITPWFYVGIILVAIIAAMMLLSGFINLFVSDAPFGHILIPRILFDFLETLQFIALIVSTVNTLLLIYLLYTYVSIYQEIRSKFTLGLIALAGALLAHTISANPIVAFLFGFHGTGLGPFAVIPSIFTLIAALVLIHLSRQ